MNLDVSGRRCLVVGGGPVAAGKVAELVSCGAVVTVVAPEVCEQLAAIDGVEILRRPYEPGEACEGYWFVVTATGDERVDAAVFEDGERAAVWVNSADDPRRCSATLPARIRRGPLLVTFSTGGESPAASRWLREQFESSIGPEHGILVELVAAERARLREEGRKVSAVDWQRALDSGMLGLIREGRVTEAKERLKACLSSSSD